MSHPPKFNKYRAAVEILQRGRDLLIEGLADDVLEQADDLIEGGFLFNEFLETQGTRLHFLTLLVAQLEQCAEVLEETRVAELPPPAVPKRRRARSKKLPQQASKEGTADD